MSQIRLEHRIREIFVLSRGKKEFLASFGPTLRRVREARNMDRETLGKSADRTGSAVQKWETGKSEPGLAELRRFAIELSVSADVLLGIEEFSGDVGVAVRYDLESVCRDLQDGALAIDEAVRILADVKKGGPAPSGKKKTSKRKRKSKKKGG